ncbi:hypothetical protein LSTR_LSTR005960 [Laodelphax striatellus]|uniref:Uncharacterized protein n=1 Tax=Laodelphax striatellus TaxID=195883 RepID=A0A482WFR8_LAOST|nr:hypothetical protein LSTR_LSTR005960 [Laodelphax striatellus]
MGEYFEETMETEILKETETEIHHRMEEYFEETMESYLHYSIFPQPEKHVLDKPGFNLMRNVELTKENQLRVNVMKPLIVGKNIEYLYNNTELKSILDYIIVETLKRCPPNPGAYLAELFSDEVIEEKLKKQNNLYKRRIGTKQADQLLFSLDNVTDWRKVLEELDREEGGDHGWIDKGELNEEREENQNEKEWIDEDSTGVEEKVVEAVKRISKEEEWKVQDGDYKKEEDRTIEGIRKTSKEEELIGGEDRVEKGEDRKKGIIKSTMNEQRIGAEETGRKDEKGRKNKEEELEELHKEDPKEQIEYVEREKQQEEEEELFESFFNGTVFDDEFNYFDFSDSDSDSKQQNIFLKDTT